jgi:hypothetical protein
MGVGWAPEPIWTRCSEEFLTRTGTRSPDHPARGPALCHPWVSKVVSSGFPICMRFLVSPMRTKRHALFTPNLMSQIFSGKYKSWIFSSARCSRTLQSVLFPKVRNKVLHAYKTAKIIKVNVKLSLCFNWAQCHEGVLCSGGISPRIFDLGTRWRWMVSFIPRPL